MPAVDKVCAASSNSLNRGAITEEFGVKTHIIAADFNNGRQIYEGIASGLKGKDIGILGKGCVGWRPFMTPRSVFIDASSIYTNGFLRSWVVSLNAS